jgi:hypothetical protein
VIVVIVVVVASRRPVVVVTWCGVEGSHWAVVDVAVLRSLVLKQSLVSYSNKYIYKRNILPGLETWMCLEPF